MFQAQENLMEAIQVFVKNLDGYDDDEDYDKESIISTNTDIFKTPSSDAITTSSSIEEPKDSLIMEDEDLNTIPEKESNEFIKSSVEDLVLIPSESEDTSENDRLFSRRLKISCVGYCPGFQDLYILCLILVWGCQIAPDLEASRARGFVHRPLELQSLAYGSPIS
nr:hypothetical protein [Tanacetum cinerariifolium]